MHMKNVKYGFLRGKKARLVWQFAAETGFVNIRMTQHVGATIWP